MIRAFLAVSMGLLGASFANAALDACQQLAQNTFREHTLQNPAALGCEIVFEGATKSMSKCSSKKGITFHFVCMKNGKKSQAPSRDMCCGQGNRHLIDWTPEDFPDPIWPTPAKPRTLPPAYELKKEDSNPAGDA